MARTRVNINPVVLTFAREGAGFDISTIAKKLQVGEERWKNWEEGEEQPTSNQLIKISGQLDRTPGFFYLEQPPVEEDTLSEFRTLKNLPLTGVTPQLIKTIREARRNRDNLLELYELQNKEVEEIPKINRDTSNFIKAGRTIRKWLDVPFSCQKKWSDSRSALSKWREILEDRDIYILQFPFIDIEEARGFTIAEPKLPVIGINSKDSYNGRIFTLMHELVHVLLRDSVLVNNELSDYWNSDDKKNKEQVCNRLAAEILVPNSILSESFNENEKILSEVERLSRLFKVSSYVILIRLKTDLLISPSEFNESVPIISKYVRKSGKSSNGGDAYNNQIVRKGRLLIRNAFQSYFNEQISLAELAQLTQWKVPNLNKLAAKTFGWPEEGSYL